MTKNELRIEYTDNKILEDLIQKSYFKQGQMGKLLGQKNFIEVTPKDDIMYTIINGLNNVTIKITNKEVIDGAIRCIIDDNGKSVKVYPISIYCVNEEDRYTFY